jgi:TubC N-terminal docking domain
MMLMVLLSELVRLDVRLFAEAESVRVRARAGDVTEELRQAMATHKADILRFACYPYVETIDGLGRLTDGIERFYWPRMVSLARPEDTWNSEV